MSLKPPQSVVTTPENTTYNAHDTGQQVRIVQNNTQFGARGASASFGAQTTPVADPNMRLVGYKTGFQDAGRVVRGWIMDGTPLANAYRVHLEKGNLPIIATAISGVSQGLIGATAINTYMPGTSVLVMLHNTDNSGYILGAIADILNAGENAVHPYITQVSRKRVDDCHKKHIKQQRANNIADWSGWRPYDGTLTSEWGAVTTTGLKITLDDFMAQMAVNEFCGVYGFYHDSMLRVAGYNMQVWTAGSERHAYMDQAEYNDISGYAAYPWEAMGALKPDTDIVKTFSPDTYQHPTEGKPYYSFWENKNDLQQPYHRTQSFRGYLGQGGRSVVHAPPKDVDLWTYKKSAAAEKGRIYDSTIKTTLGDPPKAGNDGDKENTEMQEKPAIGLHEDNVGLDGRRFIGSAKGIVLSKRMLLPMPTRIRPPEDREGDDAETNYKASSHKGAGPEHKITGDFKTSGDHPNLQRASGLLDLHGYLFNYAGFHPFHWHAKDYKTWEQSALQYAEYNHRVPDYSTLQEKMYLPEVTPKEIEIDHRYKTQKFYETESFISLLEDGSVVIGDGYGAEIKMSGGCLTLSAPGDVWIKSGRHSQLWAGGDCILRANEGVDISTTEKHVRIKSERNVMILAGNDESTPGGVLIESRATSPTYDFDRCGDDVKFGGIVLRAPKSEVVGLGKNIYLRTGGGGSSIPPGNITLDAGKGEADIVTKSSNVYQYVGQNGQIMQFFRASADDDTKKANLFSQDLTLLCGPVGTDRDFITNGNILANGSVFCTKGHIFTEVAARGTQFVAPCDGECQSQVQQGIDIFKELIDTVLPNIGDTVDEQMLEQLWYNEQRPGNAKLIDKMEFSFRTDEQYKIPDFLLYEDRWQQMARLYGSVPKKWTEKAVTNSTCGKTWPFPGGKWLDEEQAFATQDFTIVEKSGDGLRDKDRGAPGTLNDPYANPQFKDDQKKKINGEYPIVGRA